MRTLLTIVLVIAAVAGAIALYLHLTTPDEVTPLTFPLSASQRAMLARVPARVDSFAFVPSAVILHRKLLANPVTREAVERWTAEQQIPSPWLLGGADIVAWKEGKRTSYALRMDMIRAFLVRIWLMSSSNVDARWDGSLFVINASGGRAMDAADLDDILSIANGLTEGDALLVQRSRTRGLFPPIGRPAVTSVRITADDIVLHSRSKSGRQALLPVPGTPGQALLPVPGTPGQALLPVPGTPGQAGVPVLHAQHPRGALLSATFAHPPELFGDLERLIGSDVSKLVDDGGGIALYDIESGTFLPRPRGLMIIPADAEARASLGSFADIASVFGETRDTGNELLVSFDRESITQYLKDARVPAAWPANRWSARIDAPKMVPVLERLGDNRGMRLATPRLHRAARDLRRWIEALRQAQSIEAASSAGDGFEELRVRIASK